MHLVFIGRDRIVFQRNHVIEIRSGPNPQILFFIVPRIPEHLVIAQSRTGSHRQAHPIQFGIVLDSLHRPFDIPRRIRVLRLEILMKDADLLFRIVLLLKIQNQIQEKTAVLSSGKRDENVVELFKNELQPQLKTVIYVEIQIFLLHSHFDVSIRFIQRL